MTSSDKNGCKLAGISAIIHSSNRGLNSFQNMSNLYDILIEIHTWILYTYYKIVY